MTSDTPSSQPRQDREGGADPAGEAAPASGPGPVVEPGRTGGPEGREPKYADRSYRSVSGVITGVLMLAVGVFLVGDAVVHGKGRVPWLALAVLLMAAPVVIAFTLRPVVLAGEERMLVRNPFRTITLPWAAVDTVRSRYSTEVVARGVTYQVWAIPVSLRRRNRAMRARSQASAGSSGRAAGSEPEGAWAETAVRELCELAERNRDREGAAGDVSVRWAVEVIAPALAGAAVLVILLLTG